MPGRHTSFLPRRGGLRAKAAVIAVLPALGLVGLAAAMRTTESELRAHDRELERSEAVEDAAVKVLQLVVDAETGVRGYLITGDAVLLDPEVSAQRDFATAEQRLTQALANRRARGAEGRALLAAADRAFAQIEALKTTGPAAQGSAGLEVALRASKAATDELRAQTESLQALEQTAHDRDDLARAHAVAKARRRGLLVAAAGLVGGVGSSALLMSRLVRRIRSVERNAVRLAEGEPLVADSRRGSDEVGTLADALVRTSDLLEDQRRRLQLALEVGRVNVWEVNHSGAMKMQGDRADQYGATMEAGLSTLLPHHAEEVRQAVEAVRRDGEPRDYEVQSAQDGKWYAGRVMPSDSDSEVIAVSVDVTALRRAQEELRENEAQQADQALAESERRGLHHALLVGSAGEGIVAIDGTGRCISANPAAGRMLGFDDITDLVGQQFHALCHHSRPDGSHYPAEDCVGMQAVLNRVSIRIDEDVFWRTDGTRLPVSYSVSPLNNREALASSVITFTDISARLKADEELEQAAAALRRGIADGELVLHYQPKIDLTTGGCQSVEALIRWQHAGQLVYPDSFISVAERGGVIGELTDWTIRTSAAQVAEWRSKGTDLRVAVNLSAVSLDEEHLVEVLTTSAATNQIPVASLAVELTESAAAENPEAVSQLLARLATMNVRTAIDDFGTGFSSMSYLKHLPATSLKIDKAFVMNMATDTRDQAIVAATIHMAHSLGMTVIAEGVETDAVARMLRHATCDMGQGYHWSKPLPADQVLSWLAGSELAAPAAL